MGAGCLHFYWDTMFSVWAGVSVLGFPELKYRTATRDQCEHLTETQLTRAWEKQLYSGNLCALEISCGALLDSKKQKDGNLQKAFSLIIFMENFCYT